jgi:hypothetical protein
MIRFPESDLVKAVRQFWYSNIPGNFDLNGELISRKDIFTYGGPDPEFTCPICQKSEWLSRIRQKNLFQPHFCPKAKEAEDLCQKQGDELWTLYHQNFDFSVGCDSNLPAPKCLYLYSVPNENYYYFFARRCDQGYLTGPRFLAYVCQIDVVQKPVGLNWSNYDFLFMHIDSVNQKFSRPNIPTILHGHDFWDGKAIFQWVIDWLKPDIFLTSYPSQWKENFRFPPQTKIVFQSLFPSLFFSRSNLGEKKLDLLVIGATASSVYKQRIPLDKQISQMSERYKIEFSHRVGLMGAYWKGPVYYVDPSTKSPVAYLNKWFEYLGSAKYVIFGRMKYPILAWKYYETLGSGAIPIFPEVPDLKYLGVKPFKHYIPLSEVEGNNQKLTYYLDNYEKFSSIAKNAVNWYNENSDRMLFEDFENLIRGITNYKYPKRLT